MNRLRMDRIVENMKREGLRQILVTAPTSVFYLIGRWIMPGERMLALLIKDDGTARLFANRLFALSGEVDVPLTEFDDIDDSVAVLAEALDGGRVGIDKTWPSGFTLRLMALRSDITPVLGSRPVDDARMCKDEAELALMRESSRINDLAIQRAINALKPGVTEAQIAQVYVEAAQEYGASKAGFDALVCFGANCAEPHHSTDDTALKEGDSVILDVGCSYHSYCSDMTRTVFFGSVTEEQRKVYELVKAANEAGRAAVRPGVKMCAFDRAARKVIEDAGYGEYFIHRAGHGIGIEVHEFPDNSSTSQIIAQPGMVFSVEPGIYLKGKFGVRIEDLVAVTENGCETLNHLRRELLIK